LSYWHRVDPTRLALAALLLALSALVACNRPPRYGGSDIGLGDPFTIVAEGDELARQGHYEESLREYLWALDHGSKVDGAFVAARTHLVDAILDLGAKYAPARAALEERLDRLVRRIVRAAQGGPAVDQMDLVLFVRIGIKLAKESRVLETYGLVKAHLPPEADLRRDLWTPLEKYLVTQRRYQDAAAEQDVGLAAVRYYLAALRPGRADARIRRSIVFTIDNEGAVEFEALVGAGQTPAAEGFADELIQFDPTAHTFASLIRHARRAGAPALASRLHTRAYDVIPEADRVIVDEAINEVLKESK
jgi:hypothetical protein